MVYSTVVPETVKKCEVVGLGEDGLGRMRQILKPYLFTKQSSTPMSSSR